MPDSKAQALLVSVQVGQIKPLGESQVASGFVKSPVLGPIEVSRIGLKGDAQADLKVHGGPDKAVYGYAMAHYQSWLTEMPSHENLLSPGGFGENLTLDGCNENEVCLGDIYRIGSTILQVSEPRQPCSKLVLRFDEPLMPKLMNHNSRCGWYYRVLEPGKLQAGDCVTLLERPSPNWSVARFYKLIVGRSKKKLEDMRELAKMPGLSEQWHIKAQAFLARQT
jgi:MOSC domain-containing protein YiiM